MVEPIKNQNQLSFELKKEAMKEGFNPVGIARVPGGSRIRLRTASLDRWLEGGNHADMNWMKATRRKNIETLLEGVNSLLAVGLNYYYEIEPKPGTFSIGRYAWGNDYHKVIEKRLKRVGKWLENQRPNCKWKVCVDSTPLLDKAWAEEAGLGWIGKHSNLINQKYGSWIVLGHLLCTESLTPDEPTNSLCGQCQECIEACPTKAISEPFVIDSRKCLAYHTIENRSNQLPNEIKDSLGSWIAGCDICQEVCPWNKKKMPSSNDEDIIPREWIVGLTKHQALSWSDQEWSKKLKGSALSRIKPWMWRRNAAAATPK